MRQPATNIKQIAIKCKFKMAKAEMGMRLKVGYAFLFLLFYFFLRLILFKFSNRIKQRDTRQKGACHRLFIFESRGVPVYPLSPLRTPSLTPLCLFVLRLLCLFHAVSKQLSSSCRAHTNISLHFNTLLLPRPRTHSPLNSKKQQPTGRWKFFFPFPSSLLGKANQKKRKNFFCTMNFCAFSTCMSRSSPVPLPPLYLPSAGNRFVVLVACLTVKNFHFPFYFSSSAVVAAKVTALG